ncbi:hypothetical protein B9T12_06490 [Wohlfahrtiimonas chitiniclastica]|uniref:UDP-glucose 4-epimerase family protein n=1 Tax=Wohlfahrtiimonas chitiniclastica TaxID=400946 RepID=UPI000B9863B0|nr:SDR family oxidoreductase [Wohlfahrtiimonas chitiniclastica]OYQ77607.1 hypothetical protein B9T12_06490 [Wohlfahrtiimonas chitiniclastica]
MTSTLKNSIVITGANGFVGNALFNHLLQNPLYNVLAVARNISQLPLNNAIQITDLSTGTNWDAIFNEKIDTIIHCAAKVHVMNDTSMDPLTEFRKVNVDGTLKLAQEAIKNGVRRFIFISSIKVNGEETAIGKPFKSTDLPHPSDPYGISKHEAEQALLQLAKDTGLEVVIIRPVLVYGPNVKGNFNSLLKLSSSKIPLPFGSIKNARSMVYIDNLVHFITHCIQCDAAKNEILLIADDNALSLPQLIKTMRQAQGKSPLILPFPTFIFKLLGMIFNKKTVINRLLGNLQVDTVSEQQKLDWKPLYTIEQGIKYTVQNYVQRKS